MKKTITRFMMMFVALFLVLPQANAIITDPDDYLWYDTGVLGVAQDFEFPSWMQHSDSVKFQFEYFGYGTNRNADFLGKFAAVTGGRTMKEILGNPEGNASGIQLLKGDSIVMTVPVCDSIYIETWGGRGIRMYCDRNDTVWYMGYSSNYAGILGVRYNCFDTMRIVIKGSQNDVYSSKAGGSATNMYQTNSYEYFPGQNFSNPDKEMFINRIKIYKKIEKGEVPPFEGVHSAWSGRYRPQASGTVDVNSVISTGSGWEDVNYKKYASDLGVVRTMMTSSSVDGFMMGYDDNFGYATKITNLETMADTSDYTLGDQHNNYFQLDFSALKFQDLVLNFKFNILYGGGDTCVVVYKLKNDEKWTVLGKYLKIGDDSQLTDVSVVLPAAIENQRDVTIRIMAGNGDYSGNELVMSNMNIKGYDDFYASNSNAKKVAYITSATDRIHLLGRSTTADSTDAIMKFMMENADYDVTAITADMWTGCDTEEEVKALFADYDIVVLSEYLDDASDIVKSSQYLIGYKPFLNFKSDVYKVWTKGVMAVNGASDSAAIVAPSFFYHPIFATIGIDQTELVTPNLFDNVNVDALQGFTGTTNGYAIATSVNSKSICIYEDCSAPKAKYMMFAISSSQYSSVNNNCLVIIENMLSYLSGSSIFVEPDFDMVSTGAIVENANELKAALAYDYSPLKLSEVLIRMKTSTEEGKAYNLGNNNVKYGKGKLVLKPYDSNASVVIKGNLSSSERININSLTLKDIRFEGASSDENPLLIVREFDKISDGIFIENCTFSNLAKGFFQAKDADSSSVLVLSVKKSYFENIGGEAASAFIQMDNAPYELDSLVFTDNIVKHYTGKEFIKWDRVSYTCPSGEAISLNVSNNMFYEYSGNAAAEGNFIDFANKPDSLDVFVYFNNNIVYKTAGTGSSYGNFNLFTPGEDSCSLEVNHNYFYQSGIKAPKVAIAWGLIQNDVPAVETVFENEDNLLIAKLSPLYTAGVNRKYIGASSNYVDRTTPTTLTVSNVPELKTALEVAIGGDIIELRNCNDTIDVYLLGKGGFTYPTVGGELTIRAASGHSPKLFGRISPSNACRMNKITYRGLHFVDSTTFAGYNDVNYSSLIFNTRVNIGEIIMTGCLYSDQQNQYLFRTNTGCDSMYIGKVSFYENRLDNFGGSLPADGKSLGAHLIQYQNSLPYSLDTFIFENNIVTSFHGSQVFNITRPSTIDADSLMMIKINNNLFYKMGGHANSVRGFLEFNKQPVGCDVDIEINNNIFYERWSGDYFAVANLQLFENTDSLNVKVDVKNNFFEGEYYTSDETYGPNPMALTDSLFNLPNQSKTVKVNYENHPLTSSSLNVSGAIFSSLEPFTIDKTSPLYTAGTDGGYVGPKAVYGLSNGLKNVAEKQLVNHLYTKGGVLYIQSKQIESIEIFNTIGKLIYKGQVSEGLNAIDGMATGNLYLVKVGNRTSKVIL